MTKSHLKLLSILTFQVSSDGFDFWFDPDWLYERLFLQNTVSAGATTARIKAHFVYLHFLYNISYICTNESSTAIYKQLDIKSAIENSYFEMHTIKYFFENKLGTKTE